MLHSTERVIRNKVGLLNLAEELNNASRACKIMGLSRETFYRYQRAVEQGGIDAQLESLRRITIAAISRILAFCRMLFVAKVLV